MNNTLVKSASTFAIALTLFSQVGSPALARNSAYSDGVYRSDSNVDARSTVQPVQYRFYTRSRRSSVFYRHPILSRTLVGTGIGAAGGAIVGAIAGHHRAGRGALIGAGSGGLIGAGLGLFRNRQYTGRWF